MRDQPKTEASITERSNIVRSFRWLCSGKGARRVLIGLAWMATVIGLWYGEENWRGRHKWNQYQEASKGRGESLDFSSYIPKAVSDDQNFAATPFLQSFVRGNVNDVGMDDLFSHADNYISDQHLVKDKGRRHYTDLVAWQMASAALEKGALKRDQKFETEQTDLAARAAAAPVVLEGMKPDAAVFAELRAASIREYSRFPLVYDLENPWDTLLPHLAKIKQLCVRLNLQACAELAAGQSDAALADVKLILSLADSVKSEPILISFLVRAACVQIAIQPVWEGLGEHRWTEAQLQELQTHFLAHDFLRDTEPPLNAEKAMGILTIDLVKKKGLGMLPIIGAPDNRSFFLVPPEGKALSLISCVIPSGWYYQEKLNYSILFDALRAGTVDLSAKRVFPHQVWRNTGELIEQTYAGSPGRGLRMILRHRVVAGLLLPALGNIAVKGAMVQVAADQAALACALERYRLANGQFPDTLEALTPKFMAHAPNDVISGQPYKYRRTDDGQFILYSVGWNEKDDGGVPGKTLFDQTQGDWVWSYPAK